MKRPLFVEMLKKTELRVSKAGIVDSRDNGYVYGTVGNKDFNTVDRRAIPFEEIKAVEFMPIENRLTLIFNDDSRETITGTELTDDDKNSISLEPMPKTIIELNNIFPTLYPDANNQLYYDELAEREMINLSMFGRLDGGIRPVTDKIMSLYYMDIEKKLIDNGYYGTPPTYAVRDHVFNAQTFDNTRNPFRDWVESHPWDGKPRVRTWFQRLFGATAPPLQDRGLEDRYIGDVAEAWFIGAIKRMYSETKHEIVPVFISHDQGIGKGQALKYTAGRDSWYVETLADVKEREKFLDSVRGNIIVEMAESKQIRSNDVEALKGFISMSSDQFRAPYARFNDRRPRHFILAATSNLDNVFVDITGNRRFYPLYCDGNKATFNPYEEEDNGVYEVEQLWAEALQMYRDGHLWYMTEESADIAAIMQEYGTQENSNIDVIDEWLDNPDNMDSTGISYSQLGAKVDKRTILMNVYGWIEGTAVPKDVETSYRAWANGQTSWEKTAKTVRINGKVSRGYVRVVPPGERKKVVRLPISRSVKNKVGNDKDPVFVIRERARQYGFRDLGDEFPVDGLSEEMIDMFLMEGFIYDNGVPSAHDYRLAYLP